MDAMLIRQTKRHVEGGFIIEVVVWLLPVPVRGSTHRFKYRLFFGRRGERIIGYDNERGKGDHRHVGGKEMAYDFVGVDQLEADFNRDIEEWKARQ